MSEPPAPPTDAFALARRETPLGRVVAAEIADSGPMPFARYMALALGHPEHGYYARADLRWGRGGDFETSPEVHPVFGALWAEQVAECWERLGRPAGFTLVEPGAGSGRLARDVLGWLRAQHPACFAACRPVLLDGHPARRAEQRATLAAYDLHARHASVEEWTAEPRGADDPAAGVLLANEFFDALPVHLVSTAADADSPAAAHAELREWYVTRAPDGGLALAPGTPSTPALAAQLRAAGAWPAPGTRVEVSLAAAAAMGRLAGRLGRGYLLVLDYGYEATDLYAPWRRAGTLMAFRDHSPQPDPLAEPGRLDLTAHVDFTTLRRAAEGWTGAPLVAQGEALVALGIGEHLRAAHARAAADPLAYAEARRAADTLLDPAGLGRVRVLAMSREAPLAGLRCLRAAR